jgi:hypothetical protein
MQVIAFAILSVIFFVIGIALIYRGASISPDTEEVIPKKEFDSVSSELEVTRESEEKLKIQLDTIALELQHAQAIAEGAEKNRLDGEQGLRNQLQTAVSELERAKVAILESEDIRKDAEALRETNQKHQAMIAQLEANLGFLARKADEQAQKALEAITGLNTRKKDLESELTAQSNSADAELLIQKLRTQNQAFQNGIIQITEKIILAEKETLDLQAEKNQKLQNAMRLISALRQEADSFKNQAENPQEAAFLKAELARINAESEEKLAAAHDNISALQEEIRRLQTEIQENRHSYINLQNQLRANQSAPEKAGNPAFDQEKQDLEREFAELKETNLFLRQKEKLLSQELLRSQTQTLGLEKICKEFKKRFERQ